MKIHRIFLGAGCVVSVFLFGCCSNELNLATDCATNGECFKEVSSYPAYRCQEECSQLFSGTSYKSCTACLDTTRHKIFAINCNAQNECDGLRSANLYEFKNINGTIFQCMGMICENGGVPEDQVGECTSDFCDSTFVYGTSCTQTNTSLNTWNCSSTNNTDPGNNAMNCTMNICGNGTQSITDCSGGSSYR